MSRLPQVSGKDLARVLKKDGWIEVGQRGSHLKLVKYSQPVGKLTIIVPPA